MHPACAPLNLLSMKRSLLMVVIAGAGAIALLAAAELNRRPA